MKKTIVIIAVILAALLISKDFIAGAFLKFGVSSFTDLSAGARKLSLGVFKNAVDVRGFKLYNPRRDFKDRIMMDMPELYIDYDPGSFLSGTKHFKKVKINIREFVVVKNESGRLNLDSIKPVAKVNPVREVSFSNGVKAEKKQKEKEKRDSKFKIDVLDLKIDKVVYKDYSAPSGPIIKEFNVAINERYTDINDARSFASLVVFKALTKTSIASLADFNLGPLKNAASDALVNVTKIAVESAVGTAGVGGGTAKEAVSKGVETIKDLLPFGK